MCPCCSRRSTCRRTPVLAWRQRNLSQVSLYGLLEQRYRLRPWRSRQTLEATVANEHEAGLFGVPVGTPMILLEGVTYGAGDVPIEYFKALFHGDRFQFEFEGHGPDSEVGDATRQIVTPLLSDLGS